MGIFDRLFGRTRPTVGSSAESSAPTKQRPTAVPPKSEMIQIFDQFGREMHIPREEWRTKVLPESIRKSWSNPNELGTLLISALNDGFEADILPAAEQLQRLDPASSQAACIRGVALLKTQNLDDAERVLRAHLDKQGADGSVLTNLAKVQSAKGQAEQAEATLWSALEADPNQENGFGWFAAIHFERGGETAREDAYRKIAAIPGSWRAQLWLARTALSSKSFDVAIGFYREVFSRIGDPAPADALMQISGDLGNSGRLEDLLALVGPSFRPTVHGLTVGNNLIKANLDLGRFDAAQSVLESLAVQNCPPWRENLSFWEREIAKERLAANPAPAVPVSVTMLTTEGPVWLDQSSPAMPFFRAPTHSVPMVYFLGSSASKPDQSDKITTQLADAPGRLSRALPLFLAEQVAFCTTAPVKALTPWVHAGGSGFVLSGVGWSDDYVAIFAKKLAPNGVVVVSHLLTPQGKWTVELRVVQVSDGALLGRITKTFPPERPDAILSDVVDQLLPIIVRAIGSSREAAPSRYRIPTGDQLPHYLLRLEQLLTIRCAKMEGVPLTFLYGERSIVDNSLRQCVDCPNLFPLRLILAQILLSLKAIRPELIPEYRERISTLQDKYPLPPSEQHVMKELFDRVFAAGS